MDKHPAHPARSISVALAQRYAPITLKGRYPSKLSAQQMDAARTREGSAALGAWHQRVWERLLQWLNWSNHRCAQMACRAMYHARTDQEKLDKFMDLRDLVVEADRARFKCEFRGTTVTLRVAATPLEIELRWAAAMSLPGAR